MLGALVGPRLALSWLTILPVRGPSDIGRPEAKRAISSTPLVGALLGAITATLLWGLESAALPGALSGFLAVSTLTLLTRGMHIDGLADTADGLGCYGSPERAREVMRSGSAGPFGVAALVLILAVQAVSFGTLADAHRWPAVVLAVAAGRVAVVVACRVDVRAASDTGFGALVASTQSRRVVVVWSAITVFAAVPAVDDRWWQGPVVVALALAAGVVAVRHCVQRFAGISGDVLGAVLEVTTTIVLVGLLLGG